jgi:hypothetical protein
VPDDDLLLPAGTRLLHIGPHKTGTTALQRALAEARPRLEEHGVVYPGNGPSHIRAACAVTGAAGLPGAPRVRKVEWTRLVRRVGRCGDQRVVISSEFFDMADDPTARRIVDELGGDRVHVVVTLRPLAKILPSAWQQAVRGRIQLDYGSWLKAVFADEPGTRHIRNFWMRHHHDQLIARWADVVGKDRLTVVVLDETDRMMLLHTFESMVGLPAGTLEFAPGRTNRSLSLAETELVRQINVAFHTNGWSKRNYARFMRLGVVENLQLSRTPAAGEAQIQTPRWALEQATEIGAAAVPRIEQLGVRVVGDLSTLGATPATGWPEGSTELPPAVPTDAAVEAVVGAIRAGVGGSAAKRKARPSTPKLDSLSGRDLARELARRSRRRVRDRLPVSRSG